MKTHIYELHHQPLNYNYMVNWKEACTPHSTGLGGNSMGMSCTSSILTALGRVS